MSEPRVNDVLKEFGWGSGITQAEGAGNMANEILNLRRYKEDADRSLALMAITIKTLENKLEKFRQKVRLIQNNYGDGGLGDEIDKFMQADAKGNL